MKHCLFLILVVFSIQLNGQSDTLPLVEKVDTFLIKKQIVPAYYLSCKNDDGAVQSSCTYSKIYQGIHKNFILPNIAREMGMEGRTILQFQINTIGEVDSVIVMSSSGYEELDDAGIIAVKLLPKMQPALNEDKIPVRCKFEIPVMVNLK